MRIVQMLDTLEWGGAQMMQMFLVETLQPLNIELTVISLLESSGSTFEKRLKDAGIRVVHFHFEQLFSPVSFFHIVGFLRKEKFDLLHAYLTYSNIVGPLAGSLSGTPTIASIRSAGFDGKKQSKKRYDVETFVIRHFATRIMANGVAVEKFVRHRLKESRRVDTIPNAVDMIPIISADERMRIRREIAGDSNLYLIITVGRLSSAKGFADLLNAFSIVHAQSPDAVLIIAGGGSLMDDLTAQVKKLGLDGCVKMLGARTDVSRLLASADIYVNSSHREGTPVSVLEAMSAGLPVVATNVGENPYLLDADTGIIVPPHHPEKLASALISLINSDELRTRYGNSARERIKNYYSRDAWRKKLLKIGRAHV